MSELTPLYDRLNDCWKQAEAKISNLRISDEVYVDCQNIRTRLTYKIGWVCHPSGWGIAIFHSETQEWKRIFYCSVPIRSEAIFCFSALFEACKKKLVDQVEELSRCVTTFERILNEPRLDECPVGTNL